MRPYEAMIIFDSTVDEAVVDANLARVSDLVKTKEGTFGTPEKWGRRRFAYEMNHKWEGNYTVTNIDVEPAAIAELDRLLTLTDEVLRHKIVRLPDSFAGGHRPAKTTVNIPTESEGKNGR